MSLKSFWYLTSIIYQYLRTCASSSLPILAQVISISAINGNNFSKCVILNSCSRLGLRLEVINRAIMLISATRNFVRRNLYRRMLVARCIWMTLCWPYYTPLRTYVVAELPQNRVLRRTLIQIWVRKLRRKVY